LAAAQEGGSLKDRFTVPMLGPSVVETLPPQLVTLTATTAISRPSKKQKTGRAFKGRIALEYT